MRILFVTSNRIGDAVLSTGLLQHLLKQYPTASFTIACGPAASGLFESFPNLGHLHVMKKQKRAGHWLELWKAVRSVKWDVIVDLRASGLVYILRAKRRIRAQKDERLDHKVLHMARVMGLEETPPSPVNWFSEDDAAFARETVSNGGPVLVLGPTANWGGKQWPGDRFAHVASKLSAHDGPLAGAQIVVLGGPGEELAAKPCLDGLGNRLLTNLVGAASLGQVAAILSQADLYIGNDSGLMHMAAAAGVPTLGLFGPSRHEHYAPWGNKAAYVRTPETIEEIVSVSGYDFRSNETRMSSLTEESVYNAAIALLRHVKR